MKSFFCYIHIEKCAGTTLHHSLKYNYPYYLILKPWFIWTNEDGNYLKKEELKFLSKLIPKVNGIGGHTCRTYANYEEVVNGNVKYFTILRNPIDRYLSHFKHQQRKGNYLDLETFLDEPRFNNFITKRLAGFEDLRLAKERISTDYDFIGFFENFDESMVLLREILFKGETNLFYETKNINKTESVIFESLDTDYQKKIILNNQLDIQLYDYAKNQLYPNFINKVNNLEHLVSDFKRNNDIFKYNRLKYFLLRASRVYTDVVVQRLVHYYFNRLLFK